MQDPRSSGFAAAEPGKFRPKAGIRVAEAVVTGSDTHVADGDLNGAGGGVDLDDLLCEEAIDRPASYYAKLREVHPVYWNQRWNGWVVTGYPEVVAGFR